MICFDTKQALIIRRSLDLRLVELQGKLDRKEYGNGEDRQELQREITSTKKMISFIEGELA